jgi:hypothetical protein
MRSRSCGRPPRQMPCWARSPLSCQDVQRPKAHEIKQSLRAQRVKLPGANGPALARLLAQEVGAPARNWTPHCSSTPMGYTVRFCCGEEAPTEHARHAESSHSTDRFTGRISGSKQRWRARCENPLDWHAANYGRCLDHSLQPSDTLGQFQVAISMSVLTKRCSRTCLKLLGFHILALAMNVTIDRY